MVKPDEDLARLDERTQAIISRLESNSNQWREAVKSQNDRLDKLADLVAESTAMANRLRGALWLVPIGTSIFTMLISSVFGYIVTDIRARVTKLEAAPPYHIHHP